MRRTSVSVIHEVHGLNGQSVTSNSQSTWSRDCGRVVWCWLKKDLMKAHVILLVSTDSEVINAVEDAVFSERHGLRVVADRAGAVRELGADDIDLVILDHDPDLHDLNLFHTARGRVPVLVLTSREPKTMNAIMHRHGAGSCITKPFTEDGLNAAVRELLATKAIGAA